ncbi:MAG: glycosyltransferase family 2 protein [Prevotellaceae bacterium]|nr:glycosyltransferase family 2 protein [Prevotellaceae bacterium]
MISVIIPIYNVAPYITDCLQSVINQTYTDLEVLLIDDCGTDGSIQIAERIVQEYKGSIQFRILHHDRNRGLSAARNTGIDEVKGEYISFIDSDDYIVPNYYERMLDMMRMEDEDVGILVCCCNTDTDGVISDYFPTNVNTRVMLLPDEYAEAMLIPTVPHMAWGKLFRKDLFDNICFRVGRNNEDTLLALDLFPIIEKEKIKTVIVPDRLYYYRQREGSICHSIENPLFLDLVDNCEEILKKTKNLKPHIYKNKRDAYVRLLFQSILKSLDMREKGKSIYYNYCRKLRNIPNSIAHQLFNSSDFKVFCMMKYIPCIYYSKYASRKRS